jgi:hypothetical protein
VLVAEDNALNQLVIEALLERAGCSCQVVANGQEAVEAVRTGRYDLLLMDCMMPVLDGFGATEAIRAAEAEGGRGRLPIVALTASAMPDERERCAACGMDDFLAKPIDTELLTQALARWGAPAPS